MATLKATDAEILEAIDEYWRQHWTSPPVRELGAAVGLSSPATVQRRLESLVYLGRLERKVVGVRRVLYRRR